MFRRWDCNELCTDSCSAVWVGSIRGKKFIRRMKITEANSVLIKKLDRYAKKESLLRMTKLDVVLQGLPGVRGYPGQDGAPGRPGEKVKPTTNQSLPQDKPRSNQRLAISN